MLKVRVGCCQRSDVVNRGAPKRVSKRWLLAGLKVRVRLRCVGRVPAQRVVLFIDME